MILMGSVQFASGFAMTLNVKDFGLAPPVQNYAIPNEIVIPADVEGTLPAYIATGANPNCEIRGDAVDPGDTVVVDAVLAARISAVWSGPGAANERTVDVTYDGVAAAGLMGVVKCVWKGVDVLIFVGIEVL